MITIVQSQKGQLGTGYLILTVTCLCSELIKIENKYCAAIKVIYLI